MAKILDLGVSGVRSFGPESLQTITFQTPLTLILGQNGCGKTTLIEALKFAVTGEYPPNSDMGRSFIHDPKMADKSAVSGTVKLRFEDLRGWLVEVSRGMRVTQKQARLQLQTLDCSIRRKDPTGRLPPKMTTSKCIDANEEIERLLGVPKAVLTDVMFCHQEDSNWPLDEPKRVKEKFDKIFSADRYIKCLDRIRTVRKAQMERMRQVEADRRHFQENKDVAKGKRVELARREAELEHVEAEIGALDRGIEDVQKQLTDLFAKEKKMEDAKVKMEKCKTTLEQMERAQADLVRDIRSVFSGSREELEAELRGIPSRLADEEARLRDVERQLGRLEGEVKSMNARRDADQKRLGELENEERRHGERTRARLAEARRMRTDLGVSSAEGDTGEAEDEVRRLRAELDAVLEEKHLCLAATAATLDARVEQCAKKMRILGEQRSGFETEIRLKRDAVARSEADAKAKSRERDAVFVSEAEQMRLQREMDEVEADLKAQESSFDRDALDRHVRELSEVHAARSRDLRSLRLDHVALLENQGLLKRREETEEDVRAKRERIALLRARDAANLALVLDDYSSQLSVSDIRDRVEAQERKYEAQVKKKAEELKKERNELGMASGKYHHVERRLREVKSKIEDAELKIRREVGVGRSLRQAMEENEKRVADLRASIADSKAFGKLARKFLAAFESEVKPHCPVCARAFLNPGEADEAVAELKKRVKMEGEGAASEEELEECMARARTYAPLAALDSERMRLEEEEKPRISAELDSLNAATSELQAGIRVKEADLAAAQSLLDTCRSLTASVQTMAQCESELRSLQSKLDALDKKLSLSQVSETQPRSLAQVKDSLHDLEAQVEKLDVDLTHARDKREQKTEQLRQLREAKVQLEMEFLQLERKADERRKLDEAIREAGETRARLEAELSAREEELRPVREREREAELEKGAAETARTEQLDAARREIDVLNRSRTNFLRMCDEIDRYEASGTSGRLKEALERMVAHGRDLDDKRRRAEELRERSESLRSGLVEQKLREQDLRSSLTLEKYKEDMKREREALDVYRCDYETLNPAELLREKSRLNSKYIDAESARSKKRGAADELRRDVGARRFELDEPRLRDAAKNYVRKLFEHRCLEAVVRDMNRYYIVLDRAIMRFHEDKMAVVNRILRELWTDTYRGNDIVYVKVVTEQSEKMAQSGADAKRRVYNYRVVMKKNGVELDMRGRCSAGQKILACLVIRIALAETFGANCGVLALDEPTTNLDRENVAALCAGLLKIVQSRRGQRNFQLVVITHDRTFLDSMMQVEKHIFQSITVIFALLSCGMNSEKTVRELFEEGRQLLETVGNYHSQSDEYKTCVRRATLMLEDATRAVSALDVFSRNEDLSEVPVESLRFLSLPFYLGLLTLRAEWTGNDDDNDDGRRLELLRAATVYFRDFVDRLESYGVLPADGGVGAPSRCGGGGLEDMVAERRAKMERLKMVRELERRTAQLLAAAGGEDSREYWAAVLEKQGLEARDELDLVAREVPILEHRIRLTKEEEKRKKMTGGKGGAPAPVPAPASSRRPGWKPVILCRDQAQKEVFGAGYPSLPSMTVAEFYEKRVNEGWYQCGVKKAQADMGPPESDESKEERKEREEDAHDHAALEKARNWDEFKDDNPRGWGNRHNKG